jgi:hypothetical protein
MFSDKLRSASSNDTPSSFKHWEVLTSESVNSRSITRSNARTFFRFFSNYMVTRDIAKESLLSLPLLPFEILLIHQDSKGWIVPSSCIFKKWKI